MTGCQPILVGATGDMASGGMGSGIMVAATSSPALSLALLPAVAATAYRR
ncbi:hypothetical protein [Streptomyces flavofungini]